MRLKGISSLSDVVKPRCFVTVTASKSFRFVYFCTSLGHSAIGRLLFISPMRQPKIYWLLKSKSLGLFSRNGNLNWSIFTVRKEWSKIVNIYGIYLELSSFSEQHKSHWVYHLERILWVSLFTHAFRDRQPTMKVISSQTDINMQFSYTFTEVRTVEGYQFQFPLKSPPLLHSLDLIFVDFIFILFTPGFSSV